MLYQLGSDQLDTLNKFLYEDGLIPVGKHIVFDAIIMTALRQPNFSIVRKNIRQFEEDYKNPLTR